MNWKLVATLIVGALLITACGGQTQSAAPAESGTRAAQDEEATGAGANAAAPPPALQPAKEPAAAKKGIVLHD